jgi:hypothetical protein
MESITRKRFKSIEEPMISKEMIHYSQHQFYLKMKTSSQMVVCQHQLYHKY